MSVSPSIDMDHHSPWAMRARRASRRFTTLEGWKEVGQGVYAVAGSGLRTIMVDPEFDIEYSWTTPVSRTRPGKSRASENRGSRSIYTSSVIGEDEIPVTGNKFSFGTLRDLSRTPVDLEDPFSDAAAIEQPEPPYHIFSKRKKWVLVWIIGAAGLFSGLSSNIYFPSLDAIAKDLNVSMGAVSLTITSYLVVQGISPLIWGSFSDALGRRPIYIYSFSVYIFANIALSFSPNFAVLLVFRGLQAAGSASTVSIGNGVIQDITQPSERGGFISFYQAIRNFSIAIGPVFGGLFSNFLGFRSIFIFLFALSSLTLGMIVFLLPETMRSIAGNGTLRLKGIYQPLIYELRGEPPYLTEPDEDFELPKVTLATFVEPLKLLGEKDILTSLIFGGVVYAIWSMVTSSTTGLFKENFHLNELLLGLAFLPNGLGTIVGSTIIGNLMNRDYALMEERYKTSRGLPEDHKLPKKSLPDDFPIEHARLRNLWWVVGLFIASTSAYGWTLSFSSFTSRPGSIALPLFLQFVIAGTSNAVFAVNQTLVSDLCPGKGASSTAINNLVRCTLGAIGVAFVEMMIATLGVGPSFLGLGLITVACVPLLVLQWYCGMGWRMQRVERVRAKARQKGKEETDGV